MDTFIELVKIVVPALLVLLASILTLRFAMKNDQEKRRAEVIIRNHQLITPIRLQAYERMSILLERISIQSMVMRIRKDNLTAKQFHTELLNSIRQEFDHNVAQQIYISVQAWNVIKNAKENTLKLINQTIEKIPENESALLLGKKLLEKWMEQENIPTQVALEFLKKEIRQLF